MRGGILTRIRRLIGSKQSAFVDRLKLEAQVQNSVEARLKAVEIGFRNDVRLKDDHDR